MIFVSQSPVISSVLTGLISRSNRTRLPFQNLKYNTGHFSHVNSVKILVPPRGISGGNLRQSSASEFGSSYVVCSANNSYRSSFDNDSAQEPFYLTFLREAIWAVRSLFPFLAEQPSQLKYIEWPGFLSTLKTALLTLVLVALLIVALSSVDSALSFLLAFILRRPM